MTPNYMLATSAGYKLNIANQGHIPFDPKTVANKYNFRDALMERPGQPTDMYDIHTKALVTVNGFIHPTAYQDEKLYIKEAVPSMNKSGYNHIGVISFLSIKQKLEKITITEDMISPADGYSYYDKVIITLPKRIDGFIFIFAGYLIMENDQHLTRISDRSFAFYPAKIGLVDRIQELNHYYDILDELEVEKSTLDDSLALFEDVTSNKTIVKLLTRYNTFLLNFKGLLVGYECKQLEHTSIPNNYRTQELPTKILLGGQGKIIEYKSKSFNRFKHTILTTDAHYNNLTNTYTPRYALELINKNRVPSDTYRLSSVMFLDIWFNKFKYDE